MQETPLEVPFGMAAIIGAAIEGAAIIIGDGQSG